MNQQPIEVLAASTLNAFADAGFTERSLGERRFTLQKIVRLHEEHGRHFYDPLLIQLFISEVEEKYRRQSIGRIRYRYLLKTVRYLMDYHENGRIIVTSNRLIDNSLSEHYKGVLQSICNNAEWSEATKRNLRHAVMPYLKWLQAAGCDSLNQLTDHFLRRYLMDISGRMTVHSIDTIRRSLKKFHLYAFETGMISSSYQDVLSFTVPPEYRIQKPPQTDDVATVLRAIDRDTSKGKRDYAIILLAAVLGLRSIDIVMLRLDEINWATGEIVLKQTKTEKWLALPLTVDVGTALQDYILNARPKSDEPYVFLRIKPPATQIGRTLPYEVLNTYTKEVGLSKMQFHGLRRMLGTNLVIEGVPVTTVAQILGHSSIEPTKQYISLDSPRLKECALGLDGLPPYGGERP